MSSENRQPFNIFQLHTESFSRINLFLHDLQGVEPVVSVARLYREPSSAHVIGYVSKVSKKDLKTKDYLQAKIAAGTRVGKTGLESRLDSEVIGDVGYKRYEVNAYGKRIKEISVEPGKPGTNFRTTLDLDVQQVAWTSKKDFGSPTHSLGVQ